MRHPCLTCGACCAHFRVALHWSEADPALGGTVPLELTEPLRRHERAMQGTSRESPRCVALDAEIGVRSRCTIHPQRPSACRDVAASWESGAASPQCDRARLAHGLAPLAPADWHEREDTPPPIAA
jgi:Fe-S-cluster containining protein